MDSTLHRHKQDWEELAEFDPFWAVLTRRDRKNSRWDPQEFFALGESEVSVVLEESRGFSPPLPARFERALDYGCGVGRLTMALSAYFQECLGIDISERMVSLARKYNAECNANSRNCTFVVGSGADLSDVEGRSIDFVYCSLVLQHVPELRLAEDLIREFMRIVREDGIVVFQMPSRIAPLAQPRVRRRLYAVLRRLGVGSTFLIRTARSNPMRMNALPTERVRSLVEDSGGRVLFFRLDPDAPPQFNSTVYFAAVGGLART
jgi:SAM-dependent methyltransferase